MTDVDVIAGAAMQALAAHLEDIDRYAGPLIRRSITAQLAHRPGLVRDGRLSRDAQRLIRAAADDALEEFLLHRSVAA